MERMLLKTEVSFKVSDMIHEQQCIIRRNQDLFHDVCKGLADKSTAYTPILLIYYLSRQLLSS